MRHIFIINPAAGPKDCSERMCSEIEAVCSEHGIDPLIFISEYKGYETEMTQKMCSLFSNEELCFYSVGGSGTLARVISGIQDFSTTQVACVPTGMTNDFLKLYSKEDRRKFASLNNLINGEVRTFDMINAGGFRPVDYVSCGFGDSTLKENMLFSVCSAIHPKLTYILGIIIDIIKNKSIHYDIEIDGKDYSDEYSMIVFFNGNCMGGNVIPMPYARPDDGEFEIVFFKKTSVFRKLTGLIDFSNGRLDKLKDCVFTAKGKHISVSSKNQFMFNMDGEGVLSQEGKTIIELKPSKLKFVVPQGVKFISDDKQAE